MNVLAIHLSFKRCHRKQRTGQIGCGCYYHKLECYWVLILWDQTRATTHNTKIVCFSASHHVLLHIGREVECMLKIQITSCLQQLKDLTWYPIYVASPHKFLIYTMLRSVDSLKLQIRQSKHQCWQFKWEFWILTSHLDHKDGRIGIIPFILVLALKPTTVSLIFKFFWKIFRGKIIIILILTKLNQDIRSLKMKNKE